MAEFKLGRIRFIWKGEWSATTTYYKDDVVTYGGNTFICVIGHAANNDFYVDLNDSSPKWESMSSGFDWKGDWSTDTLYKINDVVKYGGYLYIANERHTSSSTAALGLEDDQSKWDLFAEGFDWKGDWSTTTRYKVNDLVSYGGRTYLCNTEHTSAASNSLGLENDQGNWDLFSDGFIWKNNWSTSTRYVYGDIVKYGGTLYLCNTGHTSAATSDLGLEDSQANWDVFHAGIDYKGDWAQSTRYKINDVVKDGSTLYICTTIHTSSTTPSIEFDQANWEVFLPGLEFEDSWDVGTFYQIGDLVTYGGYTYVAKTNNNGLIPPQNTGDWEVFLTGFTYKGEYGEDSSNQDYRPGDIVQVGGWTYLCIQESNGNRPPNASYWEKLNEGFEWNNTWTNSTYYDKGDVVYRNNTAYVCILEHTSDQSDPGAANRPDQTNGGTYWNTVASGGEQTQLTTRGDLIVRGASGPERLPIGDVGQILQVNATGTDLEWAYFGITEFVYYVEATNGVDAPAPQRGSTVDKPWKTVRYGLQQIEQGAEYFNAKNLLKPNRSFIQAEAVEWVDYQVSNTIAPFGGAFTYDKTVWREQVGQLVDSVIFDLTQGGNRATRNLTLDNYNISEYTGKTTEAHAMYEYVKSLISDVLDNVAPSSNYQTLNSVSSPITQVIDTTYTEEPNALSKSVASVDLFADTILAGVITGVPAEVFANKTLFVKTGNYEEILPLVVPENTAVVGDELRSTSITAAGSKINSNDVTESLGAIDRLRAIISDIVQNNAVTPTSGNTETQVTSRPAGSASAAADAEDLIQQIYDYIDYGINGASSDSTVPLTSGSNSPVTSTDYTYAVGVIDANRDFITEEIRAFIADTYPALVYDVDKCLTDITNYLDAVNYDLIYTGNYKSLRAAKTYVNGVSGSTTEDMFYLRNNSGLRNFTTKGLSGTLGSANSYGTKRPSAGAYASLDPGWGPDDENVWILTRSPYVQNVTTFGTGCVGAKIDGNLHNGGNDSIVANDFTQILSDGIGVWCTNLGRTELVSVFSYYGHIGYLSENGGKIRATNGNNSYGGFGAVAEGVDVTETPVTGKLDNRTRNAEVTYVLTDDNNVLAVEYSHAGENYTNATDAIITINNQSAFDANRETGTYRGISGTSSGAGTGQEFDIVIGDNGAVETITVVKGGSGHVVSDTITISDSDLGSGGAADLTFDVATIGDATRYTITGEGFGAVVDNAVIRNGGVYQVRLTDPQDSTDDALGGAGYVTASSQAQSGNTTQIVIAATDNRSSAAYVGMAIWIIGGTGAGQYAYIDTYNAATKIATVRKYSDDTAGWDHITNQSIESALDGTTEYIIEPRVTFSASPGTTALGRARVSDDQIVEIRIIEPGAGYTSPPTMLITDPNETAPVPYEVRIGDGVLGQPTWTNRGSNFVAASATIVGDGYADFYQNGTFVFVRDLTEIPRKGANVEFGDIPNKWYKLVNVRELAGTGPYFAQLQISPAIGVDEEPEHLDDVTLRIRFSQVRLTGHDFLEVGTGNFTDTNYPGEPVNPPDPDKETNNFGGGRVFYTSTDQDGNFRVGGLFNIEQSTGIATLNVESFNISGLNELQLGEIELGSSGTKITEFSTDGTFSANSDNIVPTQRAIRTYITSQIGSGSATLNVNSITAGDIKISSNVIETVTGNVITINSNVDFKTPVSGAPAALGYFFN